MRYDPLGRSDMLSMHMNIERLQALSIYCVKFGQNLFMYEELAVFSLTFCYLQVSFLGLSDRRYKWDDSVIDVVEVVRGRVACHQDCPTLTVSDTDRRYNCMAFFRFLVNS